MTWVRVHNVSRPLPRPLRARWCASWWCRFRGLMGVRALAANEGLLLVWPTASRWGTAVHMFGMRFDLAIVWLDDARHVVDVRRARAWRSVLVPRAAARYVLELRPEWLSSFHVGDVIQWEAWHE
ncbi:MAG: hypothetical protein GXO54_07610 [Chloroflexi bacterium]|nr:hypothetical protein [Chloroflexota bacterium]